MEIWKDIKDYEGLYQVSNFGRIMSLNYRRTGRSEVMKPGKNGVGYLTVGLCKNRKIKSFKVHRLVAEAFLPNPENKPCINHKIEGDKGKSMNFVFFNEDGTIDKERTTIEWCTYEENINYGSRTEKCSKPVLQLTKTGELIREWHSIAECGRNGFNQGNVVACCRGERQTHKGFLWKYK